ncbi:MAG: hypothetical protein KC464_11800 [Myxococcales bacterium]|nr:hypothetical protein [Myxococcales bacterium]
MSTETRAYLRELRELRRHGETAEQRKHRLAVDAAKREAAAWNEAHAVGTPVHLTRDDGSLGGRDLRRLPPEPGGGAVRWVVRDRHRLPGSVFLTFGNCVDAERFAEQLNRDIRRRRWAPGAVAYFLCIGWIPWLLGDRELEPDYVVERPHLQRT